MRFKLITAPHSALQKLIAVLALTLMFSNYAFADRHAALAAQASGDYAGAAKMWLQLANDGDPVAQFNLALLYQRGLGVSPDNNLEQYWYTMAAHQGLVGAYAALNPKDIQPTDQPTHVVIKMGPQQWVAAQNPNYYTLQLASSANQVLIQKYYNVNDLTGKAGYYHSRRSGEDWYSLVYGAYPSVVAAKAAIDSLPADLKKWSPWVRNIKSIQKIMIR